MYAKHCVLCPVPWPVLALFNRGFLEDILQSQSLEPRAAMFLVTSLSQGKHDKAVFVQVLLQRQMECQAPALGPWHRCTQ